MKAWIKNIASGAGKWAAGFNWQTALLKLGVVVMVAASLYGCGRMHERQAQAEREVVAAQETVKEVIKFVPVVAAQEKRAAERDTRLEKKGEAFNEAVDSNERPAACDLSDDELSKFKELVEG